MLIDKATNKAADYCEAPFAWASFTKNTNGVLVSFASIICVVWITAGWLVPNTVWNEYSLRGYLDLASLSVTVSQWHRIVSASGFVIVAFYCIAYPSLIRRFPLWAVLGIVVIYAAAPALHRLDNVALQNATATLLAMVSGLLAAFTAGSPLKLFRVLVALATVQAVYAIFGMFGGSAHDATMVSGSLKRAFGTTGVPGQVGVIMTFTIPLAVAVALTHKTSRIALFTWSALALIEIFALMATWDRAEILGAAGGGFWFLWQISRNKRRALFFGSLCLLIALSLIGIRSLGNRNQLSTTGSNRGHWMLMCDGLYHFEQHWLTGEGVGRQFRLIHPDPAVHDPPAEYTDPKCFLILWLEQLGISGGILFALVGCSILSTVSRNYTVSAIGIGAAWFAIAIAGIVDTPFGLPDLAPGTAIAGSLLGSMLLTSANIRPKHRDLMGK